MSGLETIGAHVVPNTCPFQCRSVAECRRRPECEDDARRSLVIEGIRQFGLAPDGSDLRDLEMQITRLTARVAELEGALEPFADVDGEGDEGFPDDTQAVIKFGRSTHYAVHLGDFRRARAALEPKP